MTRLFDLLAARSDSETFEPGEPIYLEGEAGSLLFVLLEGAVELERDGIVIDAVTAGEVFGESVLFGEPARTSTARARTAARVAPVGPALFRDLVHRAPEIAASVATTHRRRQAVLASRSQSTQPPSERP
jgi:CRP-like cAMP-binding protein